MYTFLKHVAVRKQTTSETCFGNVRFKDPLVLDLLLFPFIYEAINEVAMGAGRKPNFDEAREI